MASRRKSLCLFKIDCRKRTLTLGVTHVLASLLMLALLVTQWSFLSPVSSAESTVIKVPGDYPTIQAAVNAASPGNKIEVEMGVWTENIKLNKTLTLIAKEKFSTVIHANDTRRPVVEVTANNVQVIGFTIRNGSRGVEIESSNGSLLLHNKIVFNDGWGISLNLSNSTTIEGCVISSNNLDGVYLERSHNNTITESAIYSNIWYGVYFSESTNSSVFNNIMAKNQRGGIYLEGSSNDSNFMGNSILSNDYFGIELLSSNDNTFHHNNFVNNDDQVITTASTNQWNVTGEGNYWSDYTGEDLDGNGVGNTPYPINGENDAYPLMNPWTPVRWFNTTKGSSTYKVTVVSNSSITGFNFTESLDQVSFYINNAVGTYGFCNVTIPIDLLLPLGYPWLIFSNGANITSNTIVAENSTHTSLYFGFNFSATPVRIRLVAASDTDPPQADAGLDQTVEEDIRVIFNGSGSQDNLEIVDFTWTLFDETTQNLKGETPTYVFYTPGLYTVSLNVTDVSGNWDTDNVSILVLDITPPVAHAGDNQTVNEDTVVNLNASSSYDNVAIVNYSWTFTDTTPKTLTGINPTYIFETPGEYVITLNVTDAVGNWNTSISTITVMDITPPVADAGDDQTIDEDTQFIFNGSRSFDNIGISSYVWTFTDVNIQTLTGPNPAYVFNTTGTYIVTLNVTDLNGNWNTDTTNISVRDVTKPTAVILNLDTKEFEKGVIITFNGSESFDNVGIASYEWDFGDGATATGVSVSHTYKNSGTYAVTLKAKDAVGNEGIASISVTIVEGFPWLAITVIAIFVGSATVLVSALLWYRRRSREAS